MRVEVVRRGYVLLTRVVQLLLVYLLLFQNTAFLLVLLHVEGFHPAPLASYISIAKG
jgi:hypothetical protein